MSSISTGSNDPAWPAPALVDGALLVSPSQASLLHRCHRQWGFKYLSAREPRFDGVSAAAGKAFHEALKVRYRQRVATPAVEEQMRQEVVKGFEGVEVPMEDYRTCGRYLKAVEAYNREYAAEPFETLAVEMPVVVPAGNIEMPAEFWEEMGKGCMHASRKTHEADLGKGIRVVTSFCNQCKAYRHEGGPWTYDHHALPIHLKCIIDRVIRWPDGLVMVADTKTSKDWKEAHRVMWERSGAPKSYAWAVQALAKEHPELGLPPKVHGFMLDSVVIRREAATLKRARKEGIEDHLFQRLRFFYTPEQLEEWRVNFLRQVKSVLMEWMEGDLGFNETSCSNFYGRVCHYIDVCRQPDWHQRKLVLGFDKFKDREKSPFELMDSAVSSPEDNE